MCGRVLVRLRIHNTEKLEDRVMGISLRRRDQLKPVVVSRVLEKVIQSNSRFGLTDKLEFHRDQVRMPSGDGSVNTKERSLDVLSAVKKSVVVVKAVFYVWLTI
jgi:hypothetical protein